MRSSRRVNKVCALSYHAPGTRFTYVPLLYQTVPYERRQPVVFAPPTASVVSIFATETPQKRKWTSNGNNHDQSPAINRDVDLSGCKRPRPLRRRQGSPFAMLAYFWPVPAVVLLNCNHAVLGHQKNLYLDYSICFFSAECTRSSAWAGRPPPCTQLSRRSSGARPPRIKSKKKTTPGPVTTQAQCKRSWYHFGDNGSIFRFECRLRRGCMARRQCTSG